MGNEDLAVVGRIDKIGDLGLVGYYVRETSTDYTGQTDGNLSSCVNNNPQFGELTSYDQLLHVYQKKFSDGVESFYLIKEHYVTLDSTGHKVLIYNPGTGLFETLITNNYSQEVSFNVSEDLLNVYVAIQSENALTGYKYIRNGNNWDLDISNSWSADLGYVNKNGIVIATRWQNQDKQKMELDIETGSLTVVSSNLYSVTNSTVDGNYTPSEAQCGVDTNTCRFNVTPQRYYCGKTCSEYVGTRGDVISTVQTEDFIYYRSGGTEDYIEDIKTRTTTSAIKYVNHWSEHVDCSEIDDDSCSNTADSHNDINCDYGTDTNFLNSAHSNKISYNRTSSGSTYLEKTLSCGSGCYENIDVSTSSSSASCNWNAFIGGTSASVLWTGKEFWTQISNSSSNRSRSGGDLASCPSPVCNAGGNFSQWFSQYTLGSETSSESYSINSPYGFIELGSSPPDQYVFFFLEDAYENHYIEGVKYHHNGTWYAKLFINRKPFDLLNCIASTAEEFQFPILLQ
jgi:hypothetical protein